MTRLKKKHHGAGFFERIQKNNFQKPLQEILDYYQKSCIFENTKRFPISTEVKTKPALKVLLENHTQLCCLFALRFRNDLSIKQVITQTSSSVSIQTLQKFETIMDERCTSEIIKEILSLKKKLSIGTLYNKKPLVSGTRILLK